MGTMQHKAVIVTSWENDLLKEVHEKAKTIFPEKTVSELCGQGINGYQSFLIAPCGSKIHWEEEETFSTQIGEFIQCLKKYDYVDGSNSIEHVFVSYGEVGLMIKNNKNKVSCSL